MTPPDRSTLKALAEKATKGPWRVSPEGAIESPYPPPMRGIRVVGTEEDYAYIVAACNALPALLTQIDQLEADNARVAELFTEFGLRDTDDLKHALEDWERWQRHIISGVLVESGDEEAEARNQAALRDGVRSRTTAREAALRAQIAALAGILEATQDIDYLPGDGSGGQKLYPMRTMFAKMRDLGLAPNPQNP